LLRCWTYRFPLFATTSTAGPPAFGPNWSIDVNVTIEERIRRYASDLDTAAAAHVASRAEARTEELAPLGVVSARPTGVRVPRAWLIAAASLVLLATSIAVLSRRDPADVGGTVSSLGTPWVVPGPIDGYHLWYAQSLDSGRSYQERYRVLVARPAADGGFADPVTITIGERSRLWIDKERVATYEPTPTPVAGRTGEFVEDSINHTLVLQYAIDNGDVVILSPAKPTIDSRQTLLDLAAVVVPTSDGTLTTAAELPRGYQVLAAMNMHHFFGTAPLLTFIDDSRRSLIDIETEATPPPGYELFKMQQHLEPVAVRGAPGWYTSSSDSVTGMTTTASLFWRESSGEVIAITSTGRPGSDESLSMAELVAIADGLQAVSADDWQVLASEADEVGTGVGDQAGPTQVAFPTTPAAYRVDVAKLDPAADPYGIARYVPVDDSSDLPIIEIRLHHLSPEDWDQRLGTELAGHERAQANGRTLIDTSPGLNEADGTADRRAAAMEWVTNVVVEVILYMPNNTSLSLTFTDLAALAHQLNGVSFFTT
jgi:hypothetical protein